MNANELLEYLLKTKIPPEPLDEAAAYEASSLVSGRALPWCGASRGRKPCPCLCKC